MFSSLFAHWLTVKSQWSDHLAAAHDIQHVPHFLFAAAVKIFVILSIVGINHAVNGNRLIQYASQHFFRGLLVLVLADSVRMKVEFEADGQHFVIIVERVSNFQKNRERMIYILQLGDDVWPAFS